MPALYTTESIVYFTSRSAKAEDLAESALYPETVVRSYAEAATQPLVLDEVIDQLGLRVSAETLADSVEANSPLGTVIIEIKVTDPSPTQAAAIANAVAAQLEKASDSTTPGSTLADASIRVSTIAPAGVPKTPSQPRKSLMVAMALVWGVAVGVALCIWLARIDPRIRSRSDVSRLTSAPVLGYLPRETRGWGGRFGRPRHDSSSRAHWGQLRANFAVLRDGGALTSMLFVSAAAEQTSVRVISHLGGSLLAAGARVLVIDADLRSVKAEQNFGLGLSSVLLGECGLGDAVITAPDQPATLYSGPKLADPAGALASAEMIALLRAAEAAYDVVLIRTSPLLAATEGLTLSSEVDGVVLVGDRDAMNRDLFSRALRALDRAGGRVRGVVLCA